VTYDFQSLMAELNTWLSRRPRIHLGELADKLGVERHTIERAVRDLAGTSFREYQKSQNSKTSSQTSD
jgi:hypothetical protein